MKDLIDKLGQLFIVGFKGDSPPAPFLSFVEEEKIGGVIFFEENCPNHTVTRQNVEKITSRMSVAHPFVAIDQEGGRVCRLRGAPAEYKSAEEYGHEDNLEHFVEDYRRAVVMLESLGFNLNFAPVADLSLNAQGNSLMGRCFGEQPETVAGFVAASVRVAATQRVLSCLKHFPGLGAAKKDPHSTLAEADYDRMVWQQREKLPFAAGVATGADMIMTTHLRVPKLDDRPATISKRIIDELIREELGFDGAVVTDDLTMKGADELGEIGERTVAAFNAGHDILLFAQDFDEYAHAYDYFVDAFKRGEISKERVNESLNRVAGMKFKLTRSGALS